MRGKTLEVARPRNVEWSIPELSGRPAYNQVRREHSRTVSTSDACAIHDSVVFYIRIFKLQGQRVGYNQKILGEIQCSIRRVHRLEFI